MNITYKAGEIVITIPCTADTIKKAPQSKTGKSKMLATTSGFSVVDGAPAGVKLSLNLIGPLK